MLKKYSKFAFLFLVVVILFYICSRYVSYKYVDCFQREDLIEDDEIDNILWSSPDSLTKLRSMSSPPFATDVPANWLALFVKQKETDEEIIYHLYDKGENLQIDGDRYISYVNSGSGNPIGFAGWYKSKDNHFISVSDPSIKLVYYRGKIYQRISEVHLSVEKKVYNIGESYNELAIQKDYKEKGLFKYTNGKLEKISDDVKQMASMSEGLFYVPRPGSNTKLCFRISELLKKIEDGYPKRICPEYGL